LLFNKDWDANTYCSDSCRKPKIKPNSLGLSFESRILALLSQREAAQGAAAIVTCDEAEEETLKDRSESRSEGVSDEEKPSSQSLCEHMNAVDKQRGEILITQDGTVLDTSFAKGLMELILPTCSDAF